MPDKCRVMIVDDERNFTESLQLAIEDQYQVFVAGSLESARQQLRHDLPDAVLLDLHLPDGSGLDLLREVKSRPNSPVVLVMTAFGTIESFLAAANLGAEDYVTKPLDVERLKHQINRHLAARSGR